MTTVKFYLEQEMPVISEWHPCDPRGVITVSEAYDLWLPLCDDDYVFFLVHWVHVPDKDTYYQAGSTCFEFVYGQVSDFKKFEVTMLTEPKHYRTQLLADDVVLYWKSVDWS